MVILAKPDGELLVQTELAELHESCKNWISELSFWLDELRFMNDLVDKFFIKLSASRRLDHTQQLVSNIARKQYLCNRLLNEILEKEKIISRLIETDKDMEKNELRESLITMEKNVTEFFVEGRLLKKDLFLFVEQIIKEGKANRLLKK